MKALNKKLKEYALFSLMIITIGFVLYSALLSSHNRCKAVNSSVEDYRSCMNI